MFLPNLKNTNLSKPKIGQLSNTITNLKLKCILYLHQTYIAPDFCFQQVYNSIRSTVLHDNLGWIQQYLYLYTCTFGQSNIIQDIVFWDSHQGRTEDFISDMVLQFHDISNTLGILDNPIYLANMAILKKKKLDSHRVILFLSLLIVCLQRYNEDTENHFFCYLKFKISKISHNSNLPVFGSVNWFRSCKAWI